jgi:hypothetical protein
VYSLLEVCDLNRNAFRDKIRKQYTVGLILTVYMLIIVLSSNQQFNCLADAASVEMNVMCVTYAPITVCVGIFRLRLPDIPRRPAVGSSRLLLETRHSTANDVRRRLSAFDNRISDDSRRSATTAHVQRSRYEFHA